MASKVGNIARSIAKPFGGGPPDDLIKVVIADQHFFEKAHPVAYDEDQRVKAIMQRLIERGWKSSARLAQRIHAALRNVEPTP